ncbi:hypothetical protein QE152_g34421 [Popillia japonica]|uniref:Uncharacterized protein n=1 Tax=Popillia japonica TaxID=7064 RepID=A0AAW1IT10_POPJA
MKYRMNNSMPQVKLVQIKKALIEKVVQNEQLNATSETSPDQESINRESSVSSEDMEEAFISRGKVTSSGRVTKPPQRLDL